MIIVTAVMMLMMLVVTILRKLFQIKYVEGDQKLMVTVERCDGLKKESGIFGGYHHCHDGKDNPKTLIMMTNVDCIGNGEGNFDDDIYPNFFS